MISLSQFFEILEWKTTGLCIQDAYSVKRQHEFCAVILLIRQGRVLSKCSDLFRFV
jgi:hypothetical protein